MTKLLRVMRKIRDEATRFGYKQTLQNQAYHAINRILCVRRLDIIRLTRDRLAPIDPAQYTQCSSRFATEDELKKMQTEGGWDISNELMNGFYAGDHCLLSFVDGKLAGYTWIHTAGSPKLFSGLRISIHPDYLYNFAGFTRPEFRGYGLQPYRHHAILNQPEWQNKKGMIGYVEATNWSSKKGQSKSGYQRIGSITTFGTSERFVTSFSKEVKEAGIKRLSRSTSERKQLPS